MRIVSFSILIAALSPLCAAREKDAADMVDVAKAVPGIVIELRYTRSDNFFKMAFYPKNSLALLRRTTADKLAAVQAELKTHGVGLKIWDAYRPLSVQRAMWNTLPDTRYVADPAKGGRHNRGAAVDVTIVDSKGQELVMPTAHDDFSEKAAADFKFARPTALKNRKILQEAMTKHGFAIFASEWWHFDDADWQRYEALDIPIAAVKK